MNGHQAFCDELKFCRKYRCDQTVQNTKLLDCLIETKAITIRYCQCVVFVCLLFVVCSFLVAYLCRFSKDDNYGAYPHSIRNLIGVPVDLGTKYYP